MQSTPAIYRVAAVQMEPKLGEVERNLEAILSWLDRAAAASARLAVFPECALSGYGFASRALGLAHAVPIDGEPTGRVISACARHECYCVFGLLERDGAATV